MFTEHMPALLIMTSSPTLLRQFRPYSIRKDPPTEVCHEWRTGCFMFIEYMPCPPEYDFLPDLAKTCPALECYEGPSYHK